MYNNIVDFIRFIYNNKNKVIPLHEPTFSGNEKKYIIDCIDSTFVSSVGKYVDRIEIDFSEFIQSKYAVAVVNGTSALHIALKLLGVKNGDEVLTQSLSFVATSNAISYCNAKPVFIDVDKKSFGMCPNKLDFFLENHTKWVDSQLINKETLNPITACVPMHTFGHPVAIDSIVKICKKYGIPVVEDAAESLGSKYKNKYTGTFGELGIFSFNGNKTITCGGGGIIVTNNKKLAKKAKHITTTAKVPHKWNYQHDMIGYNYRMPNINAALLCAQLEQLDGIIKNKRKLAKTYSNFFENTEFRFTEEPPYSKSNFWLNSILLKNKQERDNFLEHLNNNDIMVRPIWILMNKLKMFKDCYYKDLSNSEWLEQRVVNLPSSNF